MKIKPEPKILRRGLAAVIDYGLYFALFIGYLTMFGEEENDQYTVHGWSSFVPLLIWIVYFPFFESLSGQTLGKYLIGLKVVTKAGNNIDFIQAFQRHLLDWMDLGTCGIASILTIQNNEYRQKPADLWAETVVIGGESVLCPNCHDSISLNPDEITSAKFTCPSCSRNVSLTNKF